MVRGKTESSLLPARDTVESETMIIVQECDSVLKIVKIIISKTSFFIVFII
jgi:hypothetical protein